jgi:purine-cytosine permease-like protein
VDDADDRWENGTLWFSVNACVGTFGVGYLGNEFWDLGLRDAVLAIVFFNLLTCIPPAWMATWGKVRCGCGPRLMVGTRAEANGPRSVLHGLLDGKDPRAVQPDRVYRLGQ